MIMSHDYTGWNILKIYQNYFWFPLKHLRRLTEIQKTLNYFVIYFVNSKILVPWALLLNSSFEIKFYMY